MKGADFLDEAENEFKARETDSLVRGTIRLHALNVFQFWGGLVLLVIGFAGYFTQISHLMQAVGISAFLVGAVLVYFSFQH